VKAGKQSTQTIQEKAIEPLQEENERLKALLESTNKNLLDLQKELSELEIANSRLHHCNYHSIQTGDLDDVFVDEDADEDENANRLKNYISSTIKKLGNLVGK
jgi:predicted nuclease with TOPRIM domain